MRSTLNRRRAWACCLAATIAMTLLAFAEPALAANLCVNKTGSHGCYSTITAAVAHASANDTIKVAEGAYKEDVVIPKPLSIIGSGDGTVIDATGLSNGFNIDGHGNPGLAHVVIKGFTVKNANHQGILVTNSSFVTIVDNKVLHNDQNLMLTDSGPQCPGLPVYFQQGEGFDCGEGIHFSGVNHSIVSNNLVAHNSGGILLSDDTGPTFENLIANNVVTENPYDCSITLASHHFAIPPDDKGGVFHNTISGNLSARNGLKTNEGAGVGLFTAPPGAQTYGNVVIGNTLVGNGLPGVTMHSHSPFQNLNDNQIIGNHIAGNGPDPDPGLTVPTGIDIFADEAHGAAPITGTVISQNDIRDEGIDVAVATTGPVDLHLNNLPGQVGLDNLAGGPVNATLNWWGCRGLGAGAEDSSVTKNGEHCSAILGSNVVFLPMLPSPIPSHGDAFNLGHDR